MAGTLPYLKKKCEEDLVFMISVYVFQPYTRGKDGLCLPGGKCLSAQAVQTTPGMLLGPGWQKPRVSTLHLTANVCPDSLLPSCQTQSSVS